MTQRTPEPTPGEPPNYLGEPVPYWAELLRSDDPLQRRLAAHALGMIGPSGREASAPALIEAVEGDPQSFVRVWAASALAKVDPGNPKALNGLRAAMRDDLNFVRSLGAWFLGRVGPRLSDLSAALDELERLRGDDDASVRTEAGVALRILKDKNVRTTG